MVDANVLWPIQIKIKLGGFFQGKWKLQWNAERNVMSKLANESFLHDGAPNSNYTSH